MVNNNSNQDILESQGGTPTPEKKAQDRASAVGADTGSVGSPQKKEDAVEQMKEKTGNKEKNNKSGGDKKTPNQSKNQNEKSQTGGGNDGKSKISNTKAVFMIVVAVLFDLAGVVFNLLHFIPAVGNVAAIILTALLDILAWLTFFVWFKMNGVSFANPKRALSLNGGFILKLIPILNALPAWTLAVVLIIGSMKAEALIAKQVPGGDTAVKALGKTEIKGV
ncbi:MAG: hypothetical protein HQ402_00060 [Parcubacteria group bacterium]|nr:hypothetical protein [Parcubacteria group bacterium]